MENKDPFRKHHYIWLASFARDQLTHPENDQHDIDIISDVIHELANALGAANSNFDHDLFLRNCGLADRHGNIASFTKSPTET